MISLAIIQATLSTNRNTPRTSDRDSLGNDSFRDSTVDTRHLPNYTDDSMNAPYSDKTAAAHQAQGVGANSEYIHTSLAVESAVVSLQDPLVLDVRSTHPESSRNEE
jgi:hypothetical protein